MWKNNIDHDADTLDFRILSIVVLDNWTLDLKIAIKFVEKAKTLIDKPI